MPQVFQLLVECCQAGIGILAVHSFEIGKDKRLRRGLELPESLLELLCGVHAHFGVGQEDEEIGVAHFFVVFALRAAGGHAGGEVFPDVEMQEDAALEPGFGFAVDFQFESLALGAQFFGRGEEQGYFFHTAGAGWNQLGQI